MSMRHRGNARQPQANIPRKCYVLRACARPLAGVPGSGVAGARVVSSDGCALLLSLGVSYNNKILKSRTRTSGYGKRRDNGE